MLTINIVKVLLTLFFGHFKKLFFGIHRDIKYFVSVIQSKFSKFVSKKNGKERKVQTNYLMSNIRLHAASINKKQAPPLPFP